MLGGSAAIGGDAVDLLDAASGATVDVIAGADRYETAVALSELVGATSVVAATGVGFADALVGTTLAERSGASTLLVPGDAVPNSVRARLETMAPEHLVVVGGADAVGPQAELTLTRLLPEYTPAQL